MVALVARELAHGLFFWQRETACQLLRQGSSGATDRYYALCLAEVATDLLLRGSITPEEFKEACTKDVQPAATSTSPDAKRPRAEPTSEPEWLLFLLPYESRGEPTSWGRLLLLCTSLRRSNQRVLPRAVPTAIHALLPLASSCADESQSHVQLFSLLSLVCLLEATLPLAASSFVTWEGVWDVLWSMERSFKRAETGIRACVDEIRQVQFMVTIEFICLAAEPLVMFPT